MQASVLWRYLLASSLADVRDLERACVIASLRCRVRSLVPATCWSCEMQRIVCFVSSLRSCSVCFRRRSSLFNAFCTCDGSVIVSKGFRRCLSPLPLTPLAILHSFCLHHTRSQVRKKSCNILAPFHTTMHRPCVNLCVNLRPSGPALHHTCALGFNPLFTK